jgi:zinc-finger of transposase IS204/IS1001/IS1096/IS1165
VQIWAHARARTAVCPHCGRASARVHSRYQRRLADAALGGRRLVIRLGMRRFFCDHPDCQARTFTEQITGLTTRYARRTPLLQRMLQAIGLALAGRAGARLASGLGLPASHDTLLRLLRALPDPRSTRWRCSASTILRSAAATPTAPCWWTWPPIGPSTCWQIGSRRRLRPGWATIPAPR